MIASGLSMGHQCHVGALEGAAALSSEEHPAIPNAARGAQAHEPLGLCTDPGAPAGRCSYLHSLQFPDVNELISHSLLKSPEQTSQASTNSRFFQATFPAL